MNNKGVITRGMVLLASIILFAVIGTVIAIMVGKNKSDDKYKLFENELVTGAQNYFIIKNMDIDEGEEKRKQLRMDEGKQAPKPTPSAKELPKETKKNPSNQK